MFTNNLINAIRRHECLYNKNIPCYRYKTVKQSAWQNVAISVHADVSTCQKRWRSLRDCFVRELAKGPHSEEKSWKYFKKMIFLKDYITVRRRKRCNPEFVDTGNGSSTGDYVEESYEVFHGTEEENSYDSVSQPDILQDLPKSTTDMTTDSMPTVMQEVKIEPVDHDEQTQMPEKRLPSESKEPRESSKPTSRNINFLGLLDEYLLKLPDDTQDEMKIQILNLVFNEVMNRKQSSR